MTPMLTARRGMAVIAMGALAVTGCGRSNTTTSEALTGSTLVSTTVPTTSPTTVPATSAPTTAPTTATPVTSTPSPTVPPTSTPATTPATTPTTTPTTTTVPPLTVADLTLASNGVLPITFGTAATSAVARLGQALGAPDVDEAHVYPDDTGHAYTDDLDEFEYGWPVGRTVCWQNLCVEFGGTTTDSLALTGWTYSAGSGPTITTANGVTAGSSVYDFRDAINVDAGGCYSVGYGDMDGIGLVLQSFGDPFSYTTDDGTWISQVPHPADIEVMSLEAGDRPIFLYGDC